MTRREEVSLTGIPHFIRGTLIGMAVGWLTVAVPVVAGMLALGADRQAVLFAAHVGFFGGMGFGGMLGAVLQADRFERTDAWRIHDAPSVGSGGADRERLDHAA
jgi:hypothetical protein